MADFLENVKRGLERSVASVGVRSREVLETAQLRTQIRTLQDERTRRITELGSTVYVLYIQEKLDLENQMVREGCERLAVVDRRIREGEQDIRRIQAAAQEALGGGRSPMAVCRCGADLYEGLRFCGTCGKNVEELVHRPAVAAPRCARCDAPLMADAQFCGGCGAPADAPAR